jgi:hypothetical protein
MPRLLGRDSAAGTQRSSTRPAAATVVIGGAQGKLGFGVVIGRPRGAAGLRPAMTFNRNKRY